MRPGTRKAVAIAGGLLFILVAALEMLWGHFVVGEIAVALTPDNPVIPGFDVPEAGSSFYAIYVLALAVVAGFAFALLFWEPRPGYWKRRMVYVALLFVLLPMSMYNYAAFDILMRASAQSVINIVIVFVGLILLLDTSRLEATTTDAKVLRGLVVFSLALLAVCIPALFTLMSVLSVVGVLTTESSRAFNLTSVSVLASGVSAAIAILDYRRASSSPPSAAKR